ncbi:MAG TPA: formylglycine-generating enzyme family protein [Steroidobacteraceae bacterium]|nr:formylglycine-generating enzyme family protein [Steroidobacteraceae bacterium]
MKKAVALLFIAAMSLAAEVTPAEDLALVPGGEFRSVLPVAPGVARVTVAKFKMDRLPVTNSAFSKFAVEHPEWQRGRPSKLFVDESYLSHWENVVRPKRGTERQPITQVSWYAASAYCKARGARLPTWHEWEFTAAANGTMRDARDDPAWQSTILAWYSRPSGTLPEIGKTEANLYGVYDLHGVVWEWVEDFNGMLVSSDSREQGDPNALRFCGSGALTLEQKDQYAVLMRVAMLSGMQAKYTTATMGFRCAQDESP